MRGISLNEKFKDLSPFITCCILQKISKNYKMLHWEEKKSFILICAMLEFVVEHSALFPNLCDDRIRCGTFSLSDMSLSRSNGMFATLLATYSWMIPWDFKTCPGMYLQKQKNLVHPLLRTRVCMLCFSLTPLFKHCMLSLSFGSILNKYI